MSKKKLLLDFLTKEYVGKCLEEIIEMLENEYLPRESDIKEIKTTKFNRRYLNRDSDIKDSIKFYRETIFNHLDIEILKESEFINFLKDYSTSLSSKRGIFEGLFVSRLEFKNKYYDIDIALSYTDVSVYYNILLHLRINKDLISKLEHEQIWIDKHIDIDKIIDFKQVYSRFQLYQNENQNLLKNWMSFLKYLIRKKHFKSAIAGVKIKADITYCIFLSELIFSNPTRLDSTYKKYYKDIKDSTSKGIDSILDA